MYAHTLMRNLTAVDSVARASLDWRTWRYTTDHTQVGSTSLPHRVMTVELQVSVFKCHPVVWQYASGPVNLTKYCWCPVIWIRGWTHWLQCVTASVYLRLWLPQMLRCLVLLICQVRDRTCAHLKAVPRRTPTPVTASNMSALTRWTSPTAARCLVVISATQIPAHFANTSRHGHISSGGSHCWSNQTQGIQWQQQQRQQQQKLSQRITRWGNRHHHCHSL